MHEDVADSQVQSNGAAGSGVPYVRIDGDTDSRDRRAAVKRFADEPGVRVALLSVTAAGKGLFGSLDLSGDSLAVFGKLPRGLWHANAALLRL